MQTTNKNAGQAPGASVYSSEIPHPHHIINGDKQAGRRPRTDIKRVAESALVSVDSVLNAWLPGGKRQGPEYISQNPTRSDSHPGSFSINTVTGKWADFATDEKGGDLVSLVAYLDGSSQIEAAKELAKFFGMDSAPVPGPGAKIMTTSGASPALSPVPDDVPAPPDHHHVLGKPSAVWTYKDMAGKTLFYVYRFETDTGKEHRPLSWQGGKWIWKGLPGPRPLYGLERLASHPDAIVIICEGEKATDAARHLLPEPEYVTITSPNGAQAADKADWSPLTGRQVVIWPDADEPGEQYAANVETILSCLGCAVSRVKLSVLAHFNPGGKLDELPAGWDAADAVTDGFTAALIADLIPEEGNHLLGGYTSDRRKAVDAIVEEMNQTGQAADEQQTKADALDAAIFGDPPTQFAVVDWTDAKRYGIGGAGVYHRAVDKDGKLIGPKWLCSMLRVLALTRDTNGRSWGRLLEIVDRENRSHLWAMPMNLMRGDGSEMRGELADLGLELSPGGRNRDQLSAYITTAHPETFARCVDRIGWCGTSYVLPHRVIGPSDGEMIVYQGAHQAGTEFLPSGSFDSWKECSRYAIGNSRLVLAGSIAFAPALLAITGDEGGGVHLRGTSSTGKTTALRFASSIWGRPDKFMQTWRATSNGLEGRALTRNDNLLILDELHQIDPKEAGETAYLLANGQTKIRASRSGAAREAQTFNLMFLSSGEISLSDHIATVGKRHHAGQAVRMIDLPADAGKGAGIFETTHGMTAGTLAETIKATTDTHHGHAGVAFIEAIAGADRTTITDKVKAMREFLQSALPDGADGQARRVSNRLALIAAAGELAASFGVVGWQAGEAADAMLICLNAWIEARGGAGNGEKDALIAQVRGFIESHGESRFQALDSHLDNGRPVVNRVGFWRLNDADEREYLVLAESFKKEVCKGFDPKQAPKWLHEAGILEKTEDGHLTQKRRIAGLGSTRVYVLNSSAMGGSE